MIAIPWLTGLAGRLIIGAALAACFVLIGMGAQKVLSDRTIARMQRDYEAERARAAGLVAAAEHEARRIETEWRDPVAQTERDYAANLAAQAERIAALDAAGNGLRQRLAAYTRAGGTTPAATDACGSHQRRIETLGLLLAEADGLADESSRAADQLRDGLELCRAWGQAVMARP
jgi:phage host-nuclease inhibitor protein Gam